MEERVKKGTFHCIHCHVYIMACVRLHIYTQIYMCVCVHIYVSATFSAGYLSLKMFHVINFT